MKASIVRVGEHVVNLEQLAAAHWEGEKLFMHFAGGRFVSMYGDDAMLVWLAIERTSVDLRTGEAPAERA